ncbi:MAG: geranylgeranyl reductase [Dehalococcoidia bacterium]|nr:MAG: geranylgeranyl reductase [Dehalococcoidia bacterium]
MIDFNQNPFLYCLKDCSTVVTSSPHESVDVAVVGGGPAGAVLARGTAAAGLKTVIFERDRLPRYKTCGGGVQHRVAKLVGCDLTPVIRTSVDRMVFTYRLEHPIERVSPQPVVHMVMRDAFDAYLVEQAARAGAEVRDRTRVDRVDCRDDGVDLVTASGVVRAAVVVGADGANSRVARDLGLSGGVDLDLALEAEIVTPDRLRERWATTALLDLGSLPSGYGWLFPKGDGLSVGVGGPFKDRALLRPYFEQLRRYLNLEDATVERFTGHQLTLRRPGAPIVAGRGILLGDAAGLVDPFTGEGLLGAVVSAQLAIGPVVRAVAGEPGALDDYQRAVDRELMPELLEARIVLRVFDRMPRLAHRLMGTGDLFWRNLAKLMLGETTYRSLGGGTFRVGWRLLDRLLPPAAA